MDIITLKEAKSMGLKTYYTGTECRHGHISSRRVCNRTCLECSNLYNNIHNQTPKIKILKKLSEFNIKSSVEARIKIMFKTMKRRSNPDSWILSPSDRGIKLLFSFVEFYEWAVNQKDLHRLHNQWLMSNRDRRLVPAISRINPDLHYSLDNIRVITQSECCSLIHKNNPLMRHVNVIKNR